jgi:hypothetical protein
MNEKPGLERGSWIAMSSVFAVISVALFIAGLVFSIWFMVMSWVTLAMAWASDSVAQKIQIQDMREDFVKTIRGAAEDVVRNREGNIKEMFPLGIKKKRKK